ncbi:MAG: outer membrane protein assembly factor BamD (BamD/ComL family) [Bacteriovoracaceae bacterium]|jgi:outer membrane protein assembly factor BamD (BamD/ComL family)
MLGVVSKSLLIILVTFLSQSFADEKDSNLDSDFSVYRKAQREFMKKNYVVAINNFQKFILDNKTSKDTAIKKKMFWSIDLIMRAHLKNRQNPDEAIKYLSNILKVIKFSEVEKDSIQEWISVIKDWKKQNKFSKNIRDKETLFELGDKYFQSGMEKISSPGDDTGNADFYIAASYLTPYVYNFDDSKNIGRALFMLGNIRFRSWTDYEYWSENFYLKEVIRRYPHSDLAKKAFVSLEKGTQSSYSVLSGNKIPVEQLKMLEVFRKLSETEKMKIK